MKNTLSIIIVLMSTIKIFALDLKVKERIVLTAHNLDGTITQQKLDQFSFDLKELSQDSSMCFISLVHSL